MSTLPRRAFLGARLAPYNEAFSGRGMKIVGCVSPSPAHAAGLHGGDEIIAIDETPIDSLCSLALAMRVPEEREQLRLRVLRNGTEQWLEAPVQRFPEESIADARVSYETLRVPDARLRSIVTLPKQAPRAAILLIQGISCESIDYGPSGEPLAQVIAGWTQAGYMTMRVDKRGVGDSEGQLCPDIDFETELADFRLALQALQADPRRQGAPIVLFGHSVGGMIAPILAHELPPAAMMVYGTSTANWLDCVVASTERQLGLRGRAPAAIAEHLAALRERVLQDGLNGRSADYHRQLQALDLTRLWSKVSEIPTLVLCGEYDWVLSREEQAEIAKRVIHCQVLDLPGLDHMLGFHDTQEASLADYGLGSYRPEVTRQTLRWLEAQKWAQ